MSDRQTTAVSAPSEPKTRAGAAYFFARLWKEKPLGTASGIIIVLFALTAIFADVLAPHGMLEMSLADRLSGPSARFLLGTDHVGRDLLTPLDLRRTCFDDRWPGRDRPQRRGRHGDRRCLRIRWR